MHLTKSGQATQPWRLPAAIENLSIIFPLICPVIEHGEKSDELRAKGKYAQDVPQSRSVNYVEGNVEWGAEERRCIDGGEDMIKGSPDEKFGQDGEEGDSSVVVAHEMVTLPLL